MKIHKLFSGFTGKFMMLKTLFFCSEITFICKDFTYEVANLKLESSDLLKKKKEVDDALIAKFNGLF